MGRPLRNGIVGTAIGVSGLEPLRGYQGAEDAAGYTLRTTQVAVADELAAAADLVLGKLERVPAALIRGFGASGDGSALDLVRPHDRDLFV
jgi:coenzyme F420-0:L-glutamate ligase/coenzyme F420-1:gamma-L-glutamate ligase